MTISLNQVLANKNQKILKIKDRSSEELEFQKNKEFGDFLKFGKESLLLHLRDSEKKSYEITQISELCGKKTFKDEAEVLYYLSVTKSNPRLYKVFKKSYENDITLFASMGSKYYEENLSKHKILETKIRYPFLDIQSFINTNSDNIEILKQIQSVFKGVPFIGSRIDQKIANILFMESTALRRMLANNYSSYICRDICNTVIHENVEIARSGLIKLNQIELTNFIEKNESLQSFIFLDGSTSDSLNLQSTDTGTDVIMNEVMGEIMDDLMNEFIEEDSSVNSSNVTDTNIQLKDFIKELFPFDT